jgi:hypothetical protein
MGFLYGRFGLPLPRQREIYMVTGKAVTVKHLPRDHPQFEEEVSAIQTGHGGSSI